MIHDTIPTWQSEGMRIGPNANHSEAAGVSLAVVNDAHRFFRSVLPDPNLRRDVVAIT